MDIPLPLGLTGRVEKVVEDFLTARHLGSGAVPVFATPAMIALMEWAATEAVTPHLPAGYQTVGTHVDVRHLAATPVGMKVTARAELLEVNGRDLLFRVWAEDEKELIGEGMHRRALIDVARFQRRVQAKKAPAP